MAIQVVNAAGYKPHTETPEPLRFASMSRETARQQRARAAYAGERPAPRRMGAASGLLYGLAALVLIAAGVLFASGPSETDAAQASALDLQDAMVAARTEARP